MIVENEDQSYWEKRKATESPVNRDGHMANFSVPEPYGKITTII